VDEQEFIGKTWPGFLPTRFALIARVAETQFPKNQNRTMRKKPCSTRYRTRRNTMSHAERCPVCYGEGKVRKPSNTWTTAVFEETCHGCGGKGWVTVKDRESVGYHDVDKFYPPDEEPTVAASRKVKESK